MSVYGQNLPTLQTLSEPIIHEILESDWMVHAPSSSFLDFANRVYLAQSARYSSTGSLTARSEGGYSGNPAYIYEWIIYPSKTSDQWIIGDALLTTTFDIQPVAYTKVAFAYFAIYGENPYTRALINAAMSLASSQGFGEATFENGQSAISLYGNTNGFYSDKTNEFILAAANHALQSQPLPPATTISSSASILSSTLTSVSTSGLPVSEGLSVATIAVMIACALLLIQRSRRWNRKTASSESSA